MRILQSTVPIRSFDGLISGTGAFQQNGSGTTIFTANNTYTGGTAIAAGTLQLGDGGTSGSIVGNVLEHANFAVTRSDTFSFGPDLGNGRFSADRRRHDDLYRQQHLYGRHDDRRRHFAARRWRDDRFNRWQCPEQCEFCNQPFRYVWVRWPGFGNGCIPAERRRHNNLHRQQHLYGRHDDRAGTLQLGDGGTTGALTGSVLEQRKILLVQSPEYLRLRRRDLRQRRCATERRRHDDFYRREHLYGAARRSPPAPCSSDGGTDRLDRRQCPEQCNFAINRSDTLGSMALVSGTGAFQQNGGGTTILYRRATPTPAGRHDDRRRHLAARRWRDDRLDRWQCPEQCEFCNQPFRYGCVEAFWELVHSSRTAAVTTIFTANNTLYRRHDDHRRDLATRRWRDERLGSSACPNNAKFGNQPFRYVCV